MLTISKNILITGINRGIGMHTVQMLLNRGHRVIGIGRVPFNQLSIKNLSPEDYYQADISESSQILEIAGELKRKICHIDILIHNAATGYFGTLEKQEFLAVLFRVNTIAPIMLTHTLLPVLVNSANPRVVFISSVHSTWPTKDFSTYTASKVAIEGFARSLRAEWKGRVEVQVLFPGATATEMHSYAGVPREIIDGYRRVDPKQAACRIADLILRKPYWRSLFLTDAIVRFAGRIVTPILSYRAIRNSE